MFRLSGFSCKALLGLKFELTEQEVQGLMRGFRMHVFDLAFRFVPLEARKTLPPMLLPSATRDTFKRLLCEFESRHASLGGRARKTEARIIAGDKNNPKP